MVSRLASISTSLAAAIMLLHSGSAAAADLKAYPDGAGLKDPESAQPRWAGVYVGAAVSVTVFQSRLKGAGVRNEDINARNAEAGFSPYIGYNWQFGGAVLGVEGDINTARFNETRQIAGLGAVNVKAQDYGSIRARAGYAIGRFLPFATVGLEFVGAEIASAALLRKKDEVQGVLTAGLGVDYAVDDAWSVRVDARAFGTYGYDNVQFNGGKRDLNEASGVIRAGLGYKF